MIQTDCYFGKKIKLDYYPKIDNLELTNACNFNCPTCIKTNRSTRFLDIKFLKKILDREPEVFAGQTIWLHYAGEPLMHERFSDIVKLLSNYDVACRLSTNASLLTQEKSREILGLPISLIVFSLDAFHNETFGKLRIGGDFEQVKRNIHYFLKIKEETEASTPLTQIQLVRSIQTYSEIYSFIDYWRYTSVNMINIKKYSTRAAQVAFLNKSAGMADKERRYQCFDLWNSLIILCDGNVVPCCNDFNGRLSLGDLRKTSIQGIWNSPYMKWFRKSHITRYGIPDLCCNCNDYSGGASIEALTPIKHFSASSVTYDNLDDFLHYDARNIILWK